MSRNNRLPLPSVALPPPVPYLCSEGVKGAPAVYPPPSTYSTEGAPTIYLPTQPVALRVSRVPLPYTTPPLPVALRVSRVPLPCMVRARKVKMAMTGAARENISRWRLQSNNCYILYVSKLFYNLHTYIHTHIYIIAIVHKSCLHFPCSVNNPIKTN